MTLDLMLPGRDVMDARSIFSYEATQLMGLLTPALLDNSSVGGSSSFGL